jgi:hypothetical protein
LSAQLAQRSHLVAAERMCRGLSVLGSTQVQRRRSAELDLRPFQIGDLGARKP